MVAAGHHTFCDKTESEFHREITAPNTTSALPSSCGEPLDTATRLTSVGVDGSDDQQLAEQVVSKRLDELDNEDGDSDSGVRADDPPLPQQQPLVPPQEEPANDDDGGSAEGAQVSDERTRARNNADCEGGEPDAVQPPSARSFPETMAPGGNGVQQETSCHSPSVPPAAPPADVQERTEEARRATVPMELAAAAAEPDITSAESNGGSVKGSGEPEMRDAYNIKASPRGEAEDGGPSLSAPVYDAGNSPDEDPAAPTPPAAPPTSQPVAAQGPSLPPHLVFQALAQVHQLH